MKTKKSDAIAHTDQVYPHIEENLGTISCVLLMSPEAILDLIVTDESSAELALQEWTLCLGPKTLEDTIKNLDLASVRSWDLVVVVVAAVVRGCGAHCCVLTVEKSTRVGPTVVQGTRTEILKAT